MSSKGPPCTIGMTSKRVKREPDSRDASPGKRRKLEEMNFDAACAKDNLERAGISLPSILPYDSKIFPLSSKVDMSKVEHVSSKDFQPLSWAPPAGAVDLFASVLQMAQACKSCYNTIPVVAGSKQAVTEPDTSTSSVTDTDSEEGNTSSADSQRDKPEPSLVAMGDALSIDMQALGLKGERTVNRVSARMVVLAFEPFTVIHVNRAYTKMTGVAPSDILGKPFRHALDKGELSDLLLSTGECKSLMDINGRVLRTKATKQLQCQMNVSKLSTEYYSVAG